MRAAIHEVGRGGGLMNFRTLGWPCLSLVLAACPPAAGDCGVETCSAEQRCDREALRCVADGEPVVTLVAPAAVVTTATFVISGKITDDGEFTADWSLGSGPASPLSVGADGAFSVTVDAPLLDSQAVFINVTARDGQHEIIQSKQLYGARRTSGLLCCLRNHHEAWRTSSPEVRDREACRGVRPRLSQDASACAPAGSASGA